MPLSSGVDISIVRDAIQGSAGHESIDVADTAIGITSALLANHPRAKGALITIETAPIRFTVNGTTPTSSGGASPTPSDVGHLVYHDNSIEIAGMNNLSRLRMIRATSTSAVAKVTLFE